MAFDSPNNNESPPPSFPRLRTHSFGPRLLRSGQRFFHYITDARTSLRVTSINVEIEFPALLSRSRKRNIPHRRLTKSTLRHPCLVRRGADEFALSGGQGRDDDRKHFPPSSKAAISAAAIRAGRTRINTLARLLIQNIQSRQRRRSKRGRENSESFLPVVRS